MCSQGPEDEGRRGEPSHTLHHERCRPTSRGSVLISGGWSRHVFAR